VVEETIKQMKMLQNLGMVDGDDTNDMENMNIKVKMKFAC